MEVGAFQGLILKNAVENGVNLRKVGVDRIGITVDERTRPDIIHAVWRAFGGDHLSRPDGPPPSRLPEGLLRTSAYLTHPVFQMNRAESEMTRYMRRLADRDLALDRAMIPLGSCTMKLNATAEMLPISWPEFSEIHPFVPADQARGYHDLIADLSSKLCAITGYDAISMQPTPARRANMPGCSPSGPIICRAARRTGTSASFRRPRTAPIRLRPDVRDERGRGRSDRNGNIDLEISAPRPNGRRSPGGVHDHLSVDARRVRDAHPGDCDIVHGRADRSISTAQTSMRSSGWRGPGDIGADVATSTCTRPSAFRMAAAGRAWARSA